MSYTEALKKNVEKMSPIVSKIIDRIYSSLGYSLTLDKVCSIVAWPFHPGHVARLRTLEFERLKSSGALEDMSWGDMMGHFGITKED